MADNFVPLHVHTEFSLLDGAIRLGDYLKFAQAQGWPAAAITDHGNVFGAVKFFQLAKKYNVRPILGVEQYYTSDVTLPVNAKDKYYHFTLLVNDEQGYFNLCKLMDFAYRKGFYFKPRIDFAALTQFNQGLTLLSGCLGGIISSQLNQDQDEQAEREIIKFKQLFGPERFFLEVMPAFEDEQRKVNAKLLKLADKHGLLAVATPDAHFLMPDHHKAHEVMLSVGTKSLLTDAKRFTFGEFRGHLKTTQEMLDFFPNNPEVVWNTAKVVEQSRFNFTFGKLFFPQYQVPEKLTEVDYFKQLCQQGLDRIFEEKLAPLEQREIYQARLQREVDLIVTMGFAGYFLVVGDFVQWAKKQGIPVGPGRGSAAGALVSWALQITNVDPLRFGLLFERFLNPERVSMPDVDIDFCIEGRERVIEYVKEKYGHDSVCQIITFGTMMAKGVLKDVARVLGFSFQDSQAITDLVPETLKISLKQAIAEEPMLAKMVETNPRVQELFAISQVLEGVTRHASKHAAGVVISPQPLSEVLPVYLPSKGSTEVVTQYAMTELESLGFLKMDLLGLKNLTVVGRALASIEARTGKKINLDLLDINDPEVFKMLGQGKTAGVFQFEGSGVTEVILKLQPNKFEDLIAVNALYRPGPLSSGMVDDFIAGRHGKKVPVYIFPELEPILAETYGVIVYQEQVMKVAERIAGFTLGAANILMKAMGKKKPEVMAEQKSKFLDGSKALGFDPVKSETLFDLMAHFAGYGFNKSHSAAYALIAYHTAYLKHYYPQDFIAATLTFETKDPDKMAEYLSKAKEVGVVILPPDINRSNIEFTALGDRTVLFGLQGIKAIGEACLENLVEERAKAGPFLSLWDFCKRINLRVANKRVIENLIYAGAMDKLPGNRSQKLAKLEELMARAQQEKKTELTGQIGLFGGLVAESSGNELADNSQGFANLPEMPLLELLDKEREVLGLYLSAHPMDSYRPLVDSLEHFELDIEQPAKLVANNNKPVLIIGLLQSLRQVTTKKGDKMAFLVLQDFKGQCEVVLFPKVYAAHSSNLNAGRVFLMSGTLEWKEAEQKIVLRVDWLIEADNLWNAPELALELKLELLKACSQEQVADLLQKYQVGRNRFVVQFWENQKCWMLLVDKGINLNLKILAQLRALDGYKVHLAVR